MMFEKLVQLLLDRDFNAAEALCEQYPQIINTRREYDFTLLHEYAGEEDIETLVWLLTHGADPNARNDRGITPLHIATSPEAVDVLVKHGAIVDSKSNQDETPLIVNAAESEGLPVMKKLLQLGADPNARDVYQNTALSLAIDRDEKAKVKLLRKHGAIN